MATFSDSATLGANTSQDPFETWCGVEVQSAPDYQQGQTRIDGGNMVLSGPGATELEILEVREITESDNQIGDPGWGAHVRQNPGVDEVTVTVTVEYTP